jgi:hypothetical protein
LDFFPLFPWFMRQTLFILINSLIKNPTNPI